MTSSMILLVLSVLGFCCSCAAGDWSSEKYSHRSQLLNQDGFREFAYPKTKRDFESLLDPILIPRVSGTEGNRQVRQFIVDEMKSLGWSIELDEFTAGTPEGKVPFSNIIATLDPQASRRLVIACHYDSKLFKDAEFVGAIDSAVPCAMMLHLAHTLKGPLEDHRNFRPHNLTLQFIFFDGEEAFREWSSVDSIYGARNLAQKMEQRKYLGDKNELHRMDVMVLLDLLGTKGPNVPSYFQETGHWHGHMRNIEQYLRNNRMWAGSNRGNSYLSARPSWGGIEDDHIPFMQRGVDILHIIPSPFPRVWHTPNDNKAALDFPTIDNWNKILRVFVATYLHLQPDTNSSPEDNEHGDKIEL